MGLLQERFGDEVLEPVPVRTRMREAIAEGETIFDYAPREDIAKIYKGMCDMIVSVQQEKISQRTADAEGQAEGQADGAEPQAKEEEAE